ncbi:hypothetical protein LSAT2_023570 [Lamellibrachia satsuma]|nr:hypothetical protein LSAT2_023570 [Lamellibrachia satsuma]
MSDGARSPIDRQSNHLQVSTARQQVSPHTHPHGETLVARGAHVFSHTASVRGPPSLDQPVHPTNVNNHHGNSEGNQSNDEGQNWVVYLQKEDFLCYFNTVQQRDHRHDKRLQGFIDQSMEENLKVYEGHYQQGDQWMSHAPLGSGAHAECFLATDMTTRFRFCIKLVQQADNWKSFIKEAKTLSGLHHDCIVKFYGIIYSAEKFIIIMEYVEGMSLLEVIRNPRQLNLYYCLHILKQMLDAICYCHAMKVVHKDLKVFNIMVLSDGSVRIIDFGNSKNIADPEAKPHLDLDCVVSVFLKILKLIPSKKKSSTEDKRLDKLLRENNRILQRIGARGIPQCVISLIKMGFGVSRNASKPRADELLNIVPIPFTNVAVFYDEPATEARVPLDELPLSVLELCDTDGEED